MYTDKCHESIKNKGKPGTWTNELWLWIHLGNQKVPSWSFAKSLQIGTRTENVTIPKAELYVFMAWLLKYGDSGVQPASQVLFYYAPYNWWLFFLLYLFSFYSLTAHFYRIDHRRWMVTAFHTNYWVTKNVIVNMTMQGQSLASSNSLHMCGNESAWYIPLMSSGDWFHQVLHHWKEIFRLFTSLGRIFYFTVSTHIH